MSANPLIYAAGESHRDFTLRFLAPSVTLTAHWQMLRSLSNSPRAVPCTRCGAFTGQPCLTDGHRADRRDAAVVMNSLSGEKLASAIRVVCARAMTPHIQCVPVNQQPLFVPCIRTGCAAAPFEPCLRTDGLDIGLNAVMTTHGGYPQLQIGLFHHEAPFHSARSTLFTAMLRQLDLIVADLA